MKSTLYSLYILLVLGVVNVSAQTVHRTIINSSKIKTLQVKVADEFISTPVIGLNSDKQIEINFDAIDEDYSRYAYSVVHCNADWTPSIISPFEYMDGFQGMTIDDFANSMATTASYVNYRMLLPNNDVQLKLSGNYAVNIYSEDKPNEILLTACFSVIEPLVDIDAEVSGNTVIDTNRDHQQVQFTINHRNVAIPNPLSELKLFVTQNNRRDNAVTGFSPTAIMSNRIVYDNVRDLVFKAGNEFRRIEFLSNRYNGMGVEEIQFHNPYYHVILFPDEFRSQLPYRYDQDQNGRFFVSCSGCNNPDQEADYRIVHFTLAERRISGGEVYLSGDFVNNAFNENSRMTYNHETRQYEKFMLLKEGNYNYQYLFLPNGKTKGETILPEGDFFETENEYNISVYFRPIGQRYDRLIGFVTVSNRQYH